MRNFLRVAPLMSLFALVACGAPQDPGQERLFASHNMMRHAGFSGFGPVSSGTLDVEETRSLRTNFAEDACYVVAAFGSRGLEDIGLTVLGPDETPIAEERGTGHTAIVSFCADHSGDHLVTLSAEAGTGDYHMTYWVNGGDESEEAGGNQLTLGRAVTGMLAPGTQFVDYTLRLQQRRLVTIDLQSRDFDTYLYLLRDGVEIDRNDDGGSGLNSRMALPLEAGTYTVRVGSFGNRGSGQFTLVAR